MLSEEANTRLKGQGRAGVEKLSEGSFSNLSTISRLDILHSFPFCNMNDSCLDASTQLG